MANVINSLKLGDGTYVFTTPYATCSTDAAAVEKVATITPGSNFSLETGARVSVKFTNANTAAVPTLNVNSTGGKVIYFKNAGLNRYNSWSAGQIVEFIYDGSGWVCSAVMTDTDTKNTAGATDTTSRIYLIGATSQDSNPQTYSHDTAYIGTDGCLYSNHSKVATLEDNNTFTGSNTFTKTVKLGDMNAYTGNAVSTYGAIEFYNGVFDCGKLVTDSPDDKNLTYKYNDAVVKFPKKSGTIATTADIDLMLTNTNIFTGYNYFDNPVSCRSGINATNGTNLLDSASLKYNCINRYTNDTNYTLTIPAKNGTLALTSDITDTKNTAGATDTSSLLYLIGATTQTANPQTYSHDTLYIDGSGRLHNVAANTSVSAQNTIRLDPVNQHVLVGTGGLGSEPENYAQYGTSSIICKLPTGNAYSYYFPAKTGTIALTSDIPDLSSFNTFDNAIYIEGLADSGNICNVSVNSTGSISYSEEEDNTELVLNMPIEHGATRTYTIATTNDVNNILTGSNTYTGYNSFSHRVAVTNGSNNIACLDYNCITRTNGTANYTLTIPEKSGTIALTSDIPSGGSGDVTAAGNNTFTGNNIFSGSNKFYGSVNIRESTASEGNFVEITGTGYIRAFNNEDNSVSGGKGNNLILHLPLNKEGNYTIATTSDIPIKTATLSGTTLSITLS